MNKTALLQALAHVPDTAEQIKVDAAFSTSDGSFDYVSFVCDKETPVDQNFWDMANVSRSLQLPNKRRWIARWRKA